ncbi:hypothetical protein ABT034_21180 [Streptomyces sp. NPDC002773]|uniref:hypothetical protein n=1 Tax=Streptomyces sp. NPDC002773 TaxID=3154430 RepID=UPI003322DE01
MTAGISDLEAAVIAQYGLPWPEVDESGYGPLAAALNTYAGFTLDDGWAANRHMQRLFSSGQGEAMNALAEQWVRAMDRDMAPIARSARTLAVTVSELPGAITTLKLVIASEAKALAVRNGIDMVGASLTFHPGASADAATKAVADAGQTAGRIAQRIQSTANALRQNLKALLTDPDVAALAHVPAHLSGAYGGVGGAVGGAAGAIGGVAGAVTGAGAGTGTGTGQAIGGVLRVDHEEHKLAARKLAEVAVEVRGRTTAELTTATGQHAAVKGSGAFAQALAPNIDLILDQLGAATAAVGDYLNDALPAAVLRASDSQQATDEGNRQRIAQLD